LSELERFLCLQGSGLLFQFNTNISLFYYSNLVVSYLLLDAIFPTTAGQPYCTESSLTLTYIAISRPIAKMALSTTSLAGPGYIILNILRVMNIIVLMAVIAASVVMLVKTSMMSRVFLSY
jgi:hypothetical protein